MICCPDCNHEVHAAGKCKKCNCGEGDVCHSNAISTDHTRVVTFENYRRGEISTIDVTHIKPRNTGN